MNKLSINLYIPNDFLEMEYFLKNCINIECYSRHCRSDNTRLYFITFMNDISVYYYFKSNGEFDYLKFHKNTKFYKED